MGGCLGTTVALFKGKGRELKPTESFVIKTYTGTRKVFVNVCHLKAVPYKGRFSSAGPPILFAGSAKMCRDQNGIEATVIDVYVHSYVFANLTTKLLHNQFCLHVLSFLNSLNIFTRRVDLLYALPNIVTNYKGETVDTVNSKLFTDIDILPRRVPTEVGFDRKAELARQYNMMGKGDVNSGGKETVTALRLQMDVLNQEDQEKLIISNDKKEAAKAMKRIAKLRNAQTKKGMSKNQQKLADRQKRKDKKVATAKKAVEELKLSATKVFKEINRDEKDLRESCSVHMIELSFADYKRKSKYRQQKQSKKDREIMQLEQGKQELVESVPVKKRFFELKTLAEIAKEKAAAAGELIPDGAAPSIADLRGVAKPQKMKEVFSEDHYMHPINVKKREEEELEALRATLPQVRPKIFISGWIMKNPNSKNFFMRGDGYKTRWFELKDGYLKYYEDQSLIECKGGMELQNCVLEDVQGHHNEITLKSIDGREGTHVIDDKEVNKRNSINLRFGPVEGESDCLEKDMAKWIDAFASWGVKHNKYER